MSKYYNEEEPGTPNELERNVLESPKQNAEHHVQVAHHMQQLAHQAY